MSFDNGKWWPMAYRPRETWTHARRSLDEDFLGPLKDDHRLDWADYFATGFGIGLLVGLGLIDLLEKMT